MKVSDDFLRGSVRRACLSVQCRAVGAWDRRHAVLREKIVQPNLGGYFAVLCPIRVAHTPNHFLL